MCSSQTYEIKSMGPEKPIINTTRSISLRNVIKLIDFAFFFFLQKGRSRSFYKTSQFPVKLMSADKRLAWKADALQCFITFGCCGVFFSPSTLFLRLVFLPSLHQYCSTITEEAGNTEGIVEGKKRKNPTKNVKYCRKRTLPRQFKAIWSKLI